MTKHVLLTADEIASILKFRESLPIELAAKLESAKAPTTEREARIIEIARNNRFVADGECEIDDDALISEGWDNGAYVMAWVWADLNGTELDKEPDDDLLEGGQTLDHFG